MTKFEIKIMSIGRGMKPKFFNKLFMRRSLRSLLTLLLLVAPFTEFHQFANRLLGIRRDLDKIDPTLPSQLHGILRSHYSDSSGFIDDANLRHSDLLIHPDTGILHRHLATEPVLTPRWRLRSSCCSCRT